jgi:hypothetical protein
VFTAEMKSVYSAVQTGSLNKAVCTSSLKGQSTGLLFLDSLHFYSTFPKASRTSSHIALSSIFEAVASVAPDEAKILENIFSISVLP